MTSYRVIWDNLNTHLSRKMRAFTTGHPDWLTVIQLSAYAPELNPVEGACVSDENALGNLAARTTDQLTAAMRHQLDRIQRQPALITGFLGQTGLTLEPEPPANQTSTPCNQAPPRLTQAWAFRRIKTGLSRI